jgi:hypothetical protein
VNIIRKGYKPRTGMCKDKMGNLVTGKKNVLQRWAEHFDELLNSHGDEERLKVTVMVKVKVKLKIWENTSVKKKEEMG